MVEQDKRWSKNKFSCTHPHFLCKFIFLQLFLIPIFLVKILFWALFWVNLLFWVLFWVTFIFLGDFYFWLFFFFELLFYEFVLLSTFFGQSKPTSLIPGKPVRQGDQDHSTSESRKRRRQLLILPWSLGKPVRQGDEDQLNSDSPKNCLKNYIIHHVYCISSEEVTIGNF